MSIKYLLTGAAALALVSCGGEEPAPAGGESEVVESENAETEVVESADAPGETVVEPASASEALDVVLAMQPDEVQARFADRHPKETLEFFGVQPGMTVVETLPGGGWYSKILLPYLGAEGTLVGADYAVDMWRLFGGFADEEFIQTKMTWTTDWSAEAEAWRGDNGAAVKAFQFGALPAEMEGVADVVLYVRSLHHLNRFQDEGGHLDAALRDTMAVLKPGGVVGVVQHRGPEGNDDAWAEGDNGYLKQSQVIAAFEAAGFELVESSEINANPEDKPSNEDVVWRLPPALGTSGDNETLRAEMVEIGESDRMTLKFRKPA